MKISRNDELLLLWIALSILLWFLTDVNDLNIETSQFIKYDPRTINFKYYDRIK